VNPVCTPHTVQALFTGTLGTAGAASLAGMMGGMDPAMPSGSGGFQWGQATAVCTSDWAGRRRAGTAFCASFLSVGVLSLLRVFGHAADQLDCAVFFLFGMGWYTGMGWMGTYHFIDPATGVAGVFGTQVLPFLEREELGLYAELEKTLYAGLSSSGVD
jgi:hypothetical protein